MEQVVNERPLFEDPHIKQQQMSTDGTLGVFGAELQDLTHGWYPKRQQSSGPEDYSFVKKAKRKYTNNRAEGNVLHQKGATPVMDKHKSEAEIGEGDVMKQVKQDGEGLVKTCEISTSAGKNAITAEVVSDSIVSCKKNHPVVSVLNKDGDAGVKIVSTPGGSEKTEAVKTNSGKKKRRHSKHPAYDEKKDTTYPVTQSALKSPGGSLDSGNRKRWHSKHPADAERKETTYPATLSEMEIGQRDVMKPVKQDDKGLVIENCEISASAGKNAINTEVIVWDSTVSCEKNHASPVVSVLNKDSDAEMKIVSTLGESEKTEAVKTNSRKKKRRHSKCPADAMKKETTDPATQSASIIPGGCLDSSISILNRRSEAEIGQGDVIKQAKQDVEGLVMETCEIPTSAGKNATNVEVIVSDSIVSCEKNHTSPVVSVLNKDGDVEMKIVSIPGESEKTEAAKTNSRKKKKRRSKCPADAMKKETTDPETQSASTTPGGCLDSSISILNQRSEAEIGQGDVVMKQVKQDGEGLVIETGKISTSAGKNATNAEIVSDSAVSFEKNHTSPIGSVLNKDGDAEKIVSTPWGSEKTEAVKTNSRKKKRKRSKCPADALKKETTDPATQSASITPDGCLDSSISILNQRREAEVIVSDSTVSCEKNHTSLVVSVLNKDGDAEMKIVSIPGESEKTEATKTISKKKKRRRSVCPADAMKKETTDPETQSTSITPSGCMDSSISILNQRSEAEVIVLDSTVSCEKNHTSPVVSVLNKDGDAEMKIVSIPGESEKTEAAKTISKKKKRRRSVCRADAMKKETTDPETQSTSITPGGCMDSSISILNQRSEAEIGQGDVMKQVKQDGEGLVIETGKISTSAGKNAIIAEVIVPNLAVSCEKNHTSPFGSVLNKDCDAEMIVSTPGGGEKTEAVKTNSRKKKRRGSKCLADAIMKETTDPATQSASKTPGGCLDTSISILNQRSEAEIGQEDVMKQVKQGAEGLVIEPCEISTSAGKNTINAEVIVSDSTVSCEKNHTSSAVSALNKEDDAEMKIVSTPGESKKIEAVETNSRKKKRRRSKRHADVVKKEATDPATQSASITPSGHLDSTISIVNQRSEAEIPQGDVMKQVNKDGEGLVIETCEISTSAGNNAINAEVIVSDSTVSCKKNHTSPVVSVFDKEGDAEMKIVSTPGESDKTEAVETNSRKKKRRCSKRHADPVKKETTDLTTQSASITPSGCLDSSISILNQRSEAEIGEGDVMKQVKQGAEGLVIEPCEISTSAGKNSINADSTVSCEKNHTSPVVSVMKIDGDAEMKIVSTLGESEKTEAAKTNSRKKKRRCSKRHADVVKKETTDPATQSASLTPGGCLDSSISILNHRSEAEIGKEDFVMKQVKQDGEGLVIETCAISTSAGKNAINAGEVIVSDSTVLCEKNHTSPVLSILNKDGDAEMKIVSTPGEIEKTEAVKTISKTRKRRCSKHPADAMQKESTDPVTQNASKSLGVNMDSNISILNKSSEAESGVGNVMKQDGEGLMIETCEISTSSGINDVNSEVIVSDSTVSCEKNHASPVVSASKGLGETSPRHPHYFSVTGASADLSTIDHPNQQHEQENEELISEIQNNNQPTLPVLQDEPVHIDDSGCCSMQTSDSLSQAVTSVSKRKLLVIDMNGILVDVTWTSSCGPKPDIMVSKKGVFKRPFCDDFLKFCFERFDVGVWSSRVRVNLDKIVDFVMGDAKKRLLFCWDQSHCTQTGYNTRENRQKPLVLKELRKLWEKQVRGLPWESGYYNETNTILLDDSPYKALRNPPNTAIFLHPYSYKMVGDQSLGPDGDLRKHLIRLSEAENVQKFIKENPFGQDPITESSRCWGFYRQIAEPTGKSIA